MRLRRHCAAPSLGCATYSMALSPKPVHLPPPPRRASPLELPQHRARHARGPLDQAKAELGTRSPASVALRTDKAAARRRLFNEPEELHRRALRARDGLYYRGILYWMDGEPDNARACFAPASSSATTPRTRPTPATTRSSITSTALSP